MPHILCFFCHRFRGGSPFVRYCAGAVAYWRFAKHRVFTGRDHRGLGLVAKNSETVLSGCKREAQTRQKRWCMMEEYVFSPC